MIRLARGLAERGHHVTAIFNAASDEPFSTEQTERARLAGARILSLNYKDPQSAANFREIWRAGRFDVLHCHREDALLFSAEALKGVPIPCFVVQRGTVYLPDWFSAEHRLLVSRRVDRIVAVARAVKSALAWRRLIPSRKIEVIYGGVDCDLFHPAVDGSQFRLRRGVPQGTTVITLPGALVEKKGTEYFIQAAALLRRQRQGVRFWIVGSGKREAQMKALAEQLELGPMLEFLGQCANMPEIYAASDLVVCASIKGEGLTGTLREALAMERPVVTTSVAGNTELVEEGVTGFVARPRNADSLAAAMLCALNDLPRVCELARAGRERVLALCDEKIRSEKVEALYRSVLRGRRVE